MKSWFLLITIIAFSATLHAGDKEEKKRECERLRENYKHCKRMYRMMQGKDPYHPKEFYDLVS